METENILSNYRYFVTSQQILFLHLKRDLEKIKQLGKRVVSYSTLDSAVIFYNNQYGNSKFVNFLYQVTKESIQIVDGNLNGTLNFWNRKLKDSGSDMRYCTSAKNAVKYRNKLIERDSKESKKPEYNDFQVESKVTSETSPVVTQRLTFTSDNGGYSKEDICSKGKYYYVNMDLEVKSIEITAYTSIVAKIDNNGNKIEAKIVWYDTKNKCYLRETREEAIDDLIGILSEKLKVALES